jgi:hypothetical protein
MANPDLGQYLWHTGFADKPVTVIGAHYQTLSEAPGGTRDVSFQISWGDYDARYCGTLNTRQTVQEIMRLVASGEPLVTEGRLSPSFVTGHGGEEYRLIVGVLKPFHAPDFGAITRQQRRATERQQRKR